MGEIAGLMLRMALHYHELSQKDAAELLGRPHQTINEICRGRKRITPETAADLAWATSIPAEAWVMLQAADDLRAVPDNANSTEGGSPP